MLQRLHIQHYAIIEELEINFSHHLNIITGETGAGKSILVGALGLVLGERADSSVLQPGGAKCVVEGGFAIDGLSGVQRFLTDNDLDHDDELLIRREIAANGKSRAFVNDTPVNLTQLKELGSLLVDLHQQFDTLELANAGFQQEALDALAGNKERLQQYREGYHQYRQESRELDDLKHKRESARAQQDYNQFMYDELTEASFAENELEDLDAELKLLSNAETVKQQLEAVCYELKDSEQPLVQQLKSLVNKLHALEGFHTGIEGLAKRMQGTQVELNDIAGELESINDRVQYSADRIQWLNDRIALGYRLQKKHNVNTTAGLLSIQEELAMRLGEVLNIDEAISEKEKVCAGLMKLNLERAAVISKKRSAVVVPFEDKMNRLLNQVGMPNARFKVQMTAMDSLDVSGSDRIEFLFNANLPSASADTTGGFEPIHKVASGGELSRLMLCLKSLVAEKLRMPTLVFDEIDAGISGEAARQVGNIMKGLSASHQLVAITHQPQIAARADAHHFVYKAISGDRIVTSVKLLSTEERITAIAQMLSGEKPTAAALQNAREMLGN